MHVGLFSDRDFIIKFFYVITKRVVVNQGCELLALSAGKKGLEPFPKQQILDSSKLKGFADDNFKFDTYGWKLSKKVKSTVGKRRNCSIRAISPFSTAFIKDLYCGHVKSRDCFGKS